MHAVSSGVKFKSAPSAAPIMFGTKDTPLVRWDAPLPFPTPIFRQPDMTLGFHSILFNNIWCVCKPPPPMRNVAVSLSRARALSLSLSLWLFLYDVDLCTCSVCARDVCMRTRASVGR